MSIIIKATRIKTKSGPRNITNHLLDKHHENEAIEVIQGDRQRMIDAFDLARNKPKTATYALRHFVLSSTEKMTEEQVMETVKALADEFGFDEAEATIVRHKKERNDKDVSDEHYHITVPEILENGRIMSNKKNYQRHEKICRQLEARFEFSHLAGRHNQAVAYALEDLDPETAEICEKLAQEPLPKSKYTASKYQEAKRKDIDIKTLSKDARSRCNGASDYKDIVDRLGMIDLKIIEGNKLRKDGTKTPVIATTDGFVIGSAGSVLKLNKEQIENITKGLTP
ncbi:relaxase/mobilization nuclease domain-containing protein [Neokomagataea anthophila]|uniref:MobA/VirD2-like nuclease domain-containing protein n=1 Tax=Neokomagataea anthophila TaxID=2826925 RepID=A0ABS5E773_9PROT|nr:hypothetical protein [Neokomagataea anthophila]MBR0559744.1 hypothetical protein [Neokomagataea anthophila]